MSIINKMLSPNFNGRKLPVNGIVIHYTEEELTNTLKIFGDDKRAKRVSAHYVIDRDGTVYQIVPETMRAWHAGDGYWAGITDVNSASIGIELVCLPGEKYDRRQIDSLIELCVDIQSRYDIQWVIGHSDCAFIRGKVDPGAHFPWKRLADAGIGIWSAKGAHKSPLKDRELLAGIGYNVEHEDEAMKAFILHFCPQMEHGSSAVRRCLESVYASARTVPVSPRQRAWFTGEFHRKASMLERGGQTKTGIRRQFWKDVGVDFKKVKDWTTILFGQKGAARRGDRDVLEKCLEWIDASWDDFHAVNQSMADAPVSDAGVLHGDGPKDFFLLAEKSLSEAISEDDKARIDDIMHLLDAVIFSQPRFSAGQLKSIIFSIGEFLHLCRDRAVPVVSASQAGYGYGWFRLWLWMKRIVSVLRKTAGQPERDAETGTRLGLFIPWCEIICVKMLRHKLFMKNVQHAPLYLLKEIRTTIRHAFLQSLCDGAEYFLSISQKRYASSKDAKELVDIRTAIPELQEPECREKALRVLALLRSPLESTTLHDIRKISRAGSEERQKAADILQARIVLALIMENWARYLCYSSDGGDKKLLESLIASAEVTVWTAEIAAKCKDVIQDSKGAKPCSEIGELPLEREFIVYLVSLASDMHFLKARQMDAWKRSDRRLEIRRLLDIACNIEMGLFEYVSEEAQTATGTDFVADKLSGDLARKVGYYARYWFDNQEYFEEAHHRRGGIKWLTLKDGAMEIVRQLYKNLNLHHPWESGGRGKRGEILDKLYWDYEMELWLEYDLRLSSFQFEHEKSIKQDGKKVPRKRADKEGPSPRKEWGWWGAKCDEIAQEAVEIWEDPFQTFAKIILLYSEMTWAGFPSTEHSVQAMTACRKWAAKKCHCEYYEPRKTKMNPAELLKLAMGTFLTFQNDPNGETEQYAYQEHGKETSFVKWASAVLDTQTTLHKWEDVEAVRAFMEVVAADFLYLRRYIARNSDGYKIRADEERFYLKKVLRRKGEVPYPWDFEEEIRQCVGKMGCVIPSLKTPPNSREQETFDEQKLNNITSSGYIKLCNWIRHWRGDLPHDKDIAAALGVSKQCLSYLRSEERVGKVSFQRRKSIIEHASDILGVEYSEILDELSVDRRGPDDAKVIGTLDVDTIDIDGRLERFVRVLRNIPIGAKSKWGFRENKELYERGLAQYFANLDFGGDSKRKTSLLFHEWEKAKYSSNELLSEIKSMMKRGGDFYDMPSVDRWFTHTGFSGDKDAVNILKLGFVGLEFLAADPNRQIGQEPVRDIVGRYCKCLAAVNPDWDGTKVLKAKIADLMVTTREMTTAKSFPG